MDLGSLVEALGEVGQDLDADLPAHPMRLEDLADGDQALRLQFGGAQLCVESPSVRMATTFQSFRTTSASDIRARKSSPGASVTGPS